MFLLGYNPRDEHSRREIARGERFYPHYVDLQNMQACYVSEWSALEGMRPKTYEIDEHQQADALAFVCWQRWSSPVDFRSANTVDVTHFVHRVETVVGLLSANFLAHVYSGDGKGFYKAWTPEVTSGFESFIKENISLISAYEKSVLCSSRWHCRRSRIDGDVYTPAVCLALEAKVDRLIEKSELARFILVSSEAERQRAEMARLESLRARERQIARGRAEIEALLGVNPDTLDELYDLLRVKEVES